MGADSEETADFRRSVSKLSISFDQRERAVIVGGAGPAEHLDGVAELLTRAVYDADDLNLYKDVEERLKKALREYYTNHILCWPTTEERADNDFAVLAATLVPRSSPALW